MNEWMWWMVITGVLVVFELFTGTFYVLMIAIGTALGILQHPDFHETRGTLAPGEALLFFTDGVVESREQGVEEGVEWLRSVAARAVRPGFEGAAGRIIGRVKTKDDDRAVLLLARRD